MRRIFQSTPVLLLALLLNGGVVSASSSPTFSSTRPLLLKSSGLPAHYRYRSVHVEDSVANWDGNIKPVMAIDEQNGWIEAGQEVLQDSRRRPVAITVQLFRTAGGARGDFSQFFTNSHPETIYKPGAEWLGGAPIGGLGKPATIYRYSDSSSSCPQNLVSGVTYVYGNAIFSVEDCLHTSGESGTRDLARRLFLRAKATRSS